MRQVRLAPFAHRLLRQNCCCIVVGDSINAESGNQRMPFGYSRKLRPNTWAGWIQIGNPTTGGCPAQTIQTPSASGSGLGSDAVHGFGAGLGGEGGATYSAVAADAASFPTVFDDGSWSGDEPTFNVFWSLQFTQSERNAFQGGDFLAGASTGRLLILRSATNGVSQCYVNASRNSVATGAFNGSVALSNGYNIPDLTLSSGTGDLNMNFGGSAGINETGKNLCFLGARWSANGVSGLTLANLGKGSAKVADLINTANVSAAAQAQMATAYGANTVIIWIGANDPTIDATWNTNLLTLIQQWRTAIGASFKCLLVSQYDVNNSQHDNIWAYISAAAQASTDVSAYDLRSDAGSFAFLNANYLADTVHPNAAGAQYFAGLVQANLVKSLRMARRNVA